MKANIEANIVKIQSLMAGGPEERQMALSLLDALVDTICDLELQHLLNPFFEGMTIESDYLSLPGILQKNLQTEMESLSKRSSWYRDYSEFRTLIEEDICWPLWEIYFKIYPEKVADLPAFLILEGVRKIPSFCHGNSPVKALGFSHPMYGFEGLDQCKHIQRIHFYQTALPFIRHGFRKYFYFLRNDRQFDLTPFRDAVQDGVDIALQMSNVQHLFAFNIDLSPVRFFVPHLISTNLDVEVHTNAPNVQYVTNSRVNPAMPRLETVIENDNGQKYFLLDPLGITNGVLADHPKLVQSARFLKSEESYCTLLQSHTDASYLEHVETISQSSQSISKHTVRFFLNDEIEKPIAERIEMIEMINPTQSVMQMIWSCEVVLSEIRELQINHQTTESFPLSKRLLSAFPKLEIIDIVHTSYGYQSSTLVLEPDFWDHSCQGHPLKWIRNNMAYLRQALGFRPSDTGETLEERLIFFQMNYDVAIQMLPHLKHAKHVRLQQCINLTPIQENALDLKSLLAEHNAQCDLDTVMAEYGWTEPCKSQSPLQEKPDLETALLYRPTVMAPLAKLEDILLFMERSQVWQRETLNRPMHLSKDILKVLTENFDLGNPVIAQIFDLLSRDRTYTFGIYTYFYTQGEWCRTTYQSIDGKYDQAALKGSVRNYNLERAYCQREFSGKLLNVHSIKYNTKKVPVSALKGVGNLNVLKIECPLSESEWETLTSLNTVTELYLVDQGLKVVPSALSRMTNLKKLFLWGNNFSSLPKGFSELHNLEVLSIKGSQLTDPESASILQNMIMLKQIYK